MRRAALILAIVMIISMPLTVSATPRILTIDPTLAFDGTTATCDVMVVGNNISEHIEVTMKLMNGYYCVASWQDDGYGYVWMQEDAAVTKGCTYTLVIEVTFDDVVQPPVSVNGTC